MKKLAVSLIGIALLHGLQVMSGLQIPLVKWLGVCASALGGLVFTLIKITLALFNLSPKEATLKAWGTFWTETAADWSAHVLCLAALVLGCWLLVSGKRIHWNPLTLKRWKRFRSIRRGYVSLWILLALVFIALLDDVLVGKRALIVSYNGQWRCPFLEEKAIPGREFGVSPELSETDYRELKFRFAQENKGNWVLLPLVPYDARSDTPPVLNKVEKRGDGLYYEESQTTPYTGKAFIRFRDQPDVKRTELSFRKGQLHGMVSENDESGTPMLRITYEAGVVTARTQLKEHDAAALDAAALGEVQRVKFAPTPPSLSQRHFLGTDSSGGDVLAIVVGAFQIIIGGTIVYCVLIYLLGVIIGGVSGYLGGWTDLITQRGIEIWGSLPLLYIVILLRSLNPNPSVLFVICVLSAFGWMGVAAYMRTSTYREKNRDYVAATRLLGSSNSRMVFKHIMPNTLSVLITLMPFLIDGLIGSLTALDYLGFGLPVGEPSWGTLLKDGIGNLNNYHILLAAFTALTVILILVTFIGEAVREAFDPKKFTYYS